MRLEWNGENFTDRTSDYAEGGSGRVSVGHCWHYNLTDLRMKDEFRSLQQMHVPYRHNAVRLVERCGIFVV